jgi:hypothetical protein
MENNSDKAPAIDDISDVLSFLSTNFKDANDLVTSYSQMPDEKKRQAIITFKAVHIKDLPAILERYQMGGGSVPKHILHDVDIIAKQAADAIENEDIDAMDSMLQARDYREYNALIGNYLDLLSKQCEPKADK